MNYIIKTIKSLEDLGVLIDGVTETVKHEKARKQILAASKVQPVTINFISSLRYKWKRG